MINKKKLINKKNQYLKRFISESRPAGRDGLSIREDDVFLVSYPKSGNTWVRFLLANLLSRNEIDFTNIDKIAASIYVYNNEYFKKQKSPRLIKSHEYFDHRYKKVIYVVRDPRDVCVSYYHFLKKYGKIEKNHEFNDYFIDFIKGTLFPFVNWPLHCQSWLSSFCLYPVLLVRYEDLKGDTSAELRRIADFLNVSKSDQEIDICVEKSSFEKMQKFEREAGSAWIGNRLSVDQSTSFVRKGKIGGWDKCLTEDQSEHLIRDWNEVMRDLKYF